MTYIVSEWTLKMNLILVALSLSCCRTTVQCYREVLVDCFVMSTIALRLRNDRYCVGWGIKLDSLTHVHNRVTQEKMTVSACARELELATHVLVTEPVWCGSQNFVLLTLCVTFRRQVVKRQLRKSDPAAAELLSGTGSNKRRATRTAAAVSVDPAQAMSRSDRSSRPPSKHALTRKAPGNNNNNFIVLEFIRSFVN